MVILARGGALVAVAPLARGGVTTVTEVEVTVVTPDPVGAALGALVEEVPLGAGAGF